MDPVGFALENFDAIGRWRTKDDGVAIDPSGTMYNGVKVDGVVGLRNMIASRPDIFAGVLAERMLTYALGRGLNYSDMPMVRKIVRSAAARNYRFSALVLGVVESPAFQMKVKKAAPASVAAVVTH